MILRNGLIAGAVILLAACGSDEQETAATAPETATPETAEVEVTTWGFGLEEIEAVCSMNTARSLPS